MRLILTIAMLLASFLCSNADAIVYCKRFPSDTPVACYGPDYNPPASYITNIAGWTSGPSVVYTTNPAVNVGIGTINPTTKLTVYGAATDTGIDVNSTAQSDYDAYQLSLLHLNGSNGSTTITDSATVPLTWTANGNMQISTAQSKFGGASGLFQNAATSNMSTGDSSQWAWGTSNWTLDFWIYLVTDTNGGVYEQYQDTNNRIRFYVGNGDQRVLIRSAGSNLLSFNGTATMNLNTWYHVAFVHSDTTSSGWKVYVNGVQAGSGNGNVSIPDYASSLIVGKDTDSSTYVNGYIDELRISTTARWTTAFTPPTSAYSNIGVDSPRVKWQQNGTTAFSMGVDGADASQLKIGTTAITTNTRMAIDSSGNVGISSVSPGQVLDVQGVIRGSGGSVTAPGLVLGTGVDADTGPYKGGTDDLRFANAGVNTLTLTPGNNVGINTTTVPNKLYVAGTGEFQAFKLNQNAAAGSLLTSTSVGVGTWMPTANINAGTASALAANPANCSAGNYPLGIAANGDVENCTSAAGGSSQWQTQPSVGIGTVNAVGIGTYVWGSKLTVMGNVGIGTNGSSLFVTGAGNSSGGIMIEGNVGIGTTLNQNSALTVMSGNVGIGTWKPVGPLEIKNYLKIDDVLTSTFAGNSAGAANTGVNNTAIGFEAFKTGTGNANTAFGYKALSQTFTGAGNSVLGYNACYNGNNPRSSSYNVCVGYGAGVDMTSGSNNVLVGLNAGNPFFANGLLVGNNNVFVGANSGSVGTTDVSNSVGIGSYALAGASNVMVLGGTGVNALNVGIGTDMSGASGRLIVASGNVGIGTLIPGGALTVMSGNVGIGTWKPEAELDMISPSGTWPLRFWQQTANSGTPTLIVMRTGASSPSDIGYLSAFGSGGELNMQGLNGLALTGGSSGTGSLGVYINTSGNVGIGTTIPGGALTIMNGNVGIGTWVPSGALQIVGTGNVGVGTLSPTATLEVKGNFAVKGTTSNWTVKSGANTACDTTCGTSMCAFGEDTGVIGTLLACTDATSDKCICMGP